MRGTIKKTFKAATLTAGATFSSVCLAVEVRRNAVAGTMDFIEGWVEGLWVELIPAPGEIVGGDED